MKVRFLPVAAFTLLLALLVAIMWRLNAPVRPDPALVRLAIQATLEALPSPTPWVVEVTRVFEVTREVTPVPSPTQLPTATPTASATPVPEEPAEAAAPSGAERTTGAGAMDDIQMAAAEVTYVEEASAPAGASPPADVPAPVAAPAACPQSSDNQYTTVPIVGAPANHPDVQHGDLNLNLRGWTAVGAAGGIADIDGPADSDPPWMAGIYQDQRFPGFGAGFQVFDWNWGCAEHGCRGDLLSYRDMTLVEYGANPGEPLGIPHRDAQIYGGEYKVLVLYADEGQITLGYTRDDSVAHGYSVHLANICVDPNLLALYRSSNGAGRGYLPALRNEEVLGTATGSLLVAVRDRGVFLDPRSRKDWWRGF